MPGVALPDYLAQLATHLADEQAAALKELAGLQNNIEHIKDIVNMQQGLAKASGFKEKLKMSDLVEDALRMNRARSARHDIKSSTNSKTCRWSRWKNTKFCKSSVNLVRNAKQACEISGHEENK